MMIQIQKTQNKKWLSLASAVIVALTVSACNGQPATNNPAPTAEPVASAPAQTASVEATASAPSSESAITSKDGKISIKTNGVFSDKLGANEYSPEGITNDELVLLQRDDSNNLTIYVAKFAQPKDKVDAYFTKLKEVIEKEPNFKNVQTSLENNVLKYQFSHGETTLNESCVVQSVENNIYSVCANSPDLDLASVADSIKNIEIK